MIKIQGGTQEHYNVADFSNPMSGNTAEDESLNIPVTSFENHQGDQYYYVCLLTEEYGTYAHISTIATTDIWCSNTKMAHFYIAITKHLMHHITTAMV
jgi:hypothetical protein